LLTLIVKSRRAAQPDQTFSMKIQIRTLVALMLLAAPSAVVAQTQDPQSPATSGFGGLNPGDQIRILVWRNTEYSGDFNIASNGTITHPLYREVQVTGVPMATVEERLRTFLSRYLTNPQFVIQPLVRVIVGGEVRTPNIFSVPQETTIAQAIALAGGPTDRGDLREVSVIRERQSIKFDLSRADSDAGVLQIRSGDQILVGRKGASFMTVLGPVTSTIAAIAAITAVIRR
jgi:polysaccharide export outer membrane protein